MAAKKPAPKKGDKFGGKKAPPFGKGGKQEKEAPKKGK